MVPNTSSYWSKTNKQTTIYLLPCVYTPAKRQDFLGPDGDINQLDFLSTKPFLLLFLEVLSSFNLHGKNCVSQLNAKCMETIHCIQIAIKNNSTALLSTKHYMNNKRKYKLNERKQ